MKEITSVDEISMNAELTSVDGISVNAPKEITTMDGFSMIEPKEITSITYQKKGDKVTVYLDNEYFLVVKYEIANEFQLKVGSKLAKDVIRIIVLKEKIAEAYDCGLKYTLRRKVSKKQMKVWLMGKGYSRFEVDFAVRSLEENGYIVDDRTFTQAYIHTYGNERGSIRLRAELKRAGVRDDVIESELVFLSDNDACKRCIQKFARTHDDFDKQKLFKYLMYRGFDYSQIYQSLADLNM